MSWWIALLLSTADPGSPPPESVLVSGRVRIQSAAYPETRNVQSRRFDISLTRYADTVVSAQACIFADLKADSDWNGSCLPLRRGSLRDWEAFLKTTSGVMPVDPFAQAVLRVLIGQVNPRLGDWGRRIVGFDPNTALSVQSDASQVYSTE